MTARHLSSFLSMAEGPLWLEDNIIGGQRSAANVTKEEI